jgi:hypothetical protein
MKSDTLANWIQIGANVGILIGLILVAFQISQNSEIAKADMLSRNWELSAQSWLALLGEDGASAWSVAINDPDNITDEELVMVHGYLTFWWDLNSRREYLTKFSLMDDDWLSFAGWQSANIFGGNKVTRAWWSTNVQNPSLRWEIAVHEQMGSSSNESNAEFFNAIRQRVKTAK